MRILLDGYFDYNLGDDLMMTLVAMGLREHEVFLPSKKLRIDSAKYTDEIKNFDAYVKVTGSGFVIRDNLGVIYRMRDTRRENKYSKKKAVIGCNISNLRGMALRAVIKQLEGYGLITVRDQFSYNFVKENLPSANCELYPELVFSMPDDMIPDLPCENRLGIALRGGAQSETLAKIADGYVEKTGNCVSILCFDAGDEDDLHLAKNVMERVVNKDKIEIVEYKSIEQILGEIKRCSVMLGIRYHSIILALIMGIPFVPLSYSSKTVNVLREVGYEEEVPFVKTVKAEDILERLLSAKPFKLDKSVREEAKKHIVKLNEFLQKQ